MEWLSKAWRFLKSEKNQKTLAFIGGVITAVAIGGWQVYTYFAGVRRRPGRPRKRSQPRDGGLASGGDINITQSAPGNLIVGGVHGVRPEDFQRVSEELGVTKAALTSFFKILEKKNVPPEDLGQHPARVRQALQGSSRRSSFVLPFR